jgi:hypothetical protein
MLWVEFHRKNKTMLFRIVIVLVCVVSFINGCSSLISRVGGTHKLRTYTMEQVLEKGIGDADYILVEGAWRSGDFVHTPPLKRGYKPVVAYPVLTSAQSDSVVAGMTVRPAVIAWSQKFDPACVELGTCALQGAFVLEGITRKIDKERNRSKELEEKRYSIADNIVYIEIGRKPLDWYWNLAIMLAAAAIGGGVELYHFRKGRRREGA